jgi:hypothetical protein
MKVDELLAMMDAVRSTRRGWSARCPAHEDRKPSLHIHEGQRGVLVKCFAGCTVDEVCTALGLKVRDLFYEGTTDTQVWQEQKRQRVEKHFWERHIRFLSGVFTDRLREAEAFVSAAKGIDISQWNDSKLAETLDLLSDCYDLLEKEQRTHEFGSI